MQLVLFHLSVISLYSFTFWYDQKYVEIPYPSKEFEHIPLKARVMFFTFWNLVLQTVYFTISLLNDIIGTNAATKKPPLIRQIKDVLFSIIVCTALYVVIVFWIFYTFDKGAIFPEAAEKAFPVWLNHVLHTLILPIIFVELLVTKRNYPSMKQGFSIAIFIAALYSTYINILYFKYGIWPYPFLYVVSWTTKTLYFAGSAVLSFVLYMFGEKLDTFVTQKTGSRIAYLNGIKKIH